MRYQLNVHLQMMLLLLLGTSLANKYKFVFENEELFTDCTDQPSKVLSLNDIIDFSQGTFTLQPESVKVKGNFIHWWDLDPKDRIELYIVAFRHERGTWVQTVFSMKIPNFCQVLFDKRQYWYMGWTQYMTNKDEFKKECFLNGSVARHEEFEVNSTFDMLGMNLSGLHKLVITIKIFNNNNVLRKTICTEILGEVKRM